MNTAATLAKVNKRMKEQSKKILSTPALLNLVLKEKYYTMTGEPGKMYELRKPTKWLLSRLLNKDGTKKKFDGVELCCGYQKNRETKIRDFRGWAFFTATCSHTLPNGEIIHCEKGDIIIWL